MPEKRNDVPGPGPHGSRRYFWWPFRRKKAAKQQVRPGALSPAEVKKQIDEVGIGKQVQIIRIGFDGTIDDMPIIVEILDIGSEGFTGKIINVERHLIESSTAKLVYAKRGGGTIDFRYDDGDIKEILIPRDEELISEERDVETLKEVLQALDVDDRVLIAYYDNREKGTLNAEGSIMEKNSETDFVLRIEKINNIELENKITRNFDIQNDLVIDIELI